MTAYRWTPLHVQNRIPVQMHSWMLVETTGVTEFEYYFACSRKGVFCAINNFFIIKIITTNYHGRSHACARWALTPTGKVEKCCHVKKQLHLRSQFERPRRSLFFREVRRWTIVQYRLRYFISADYKIIVLFYEYFEGERVDDGRGPQIWNRANGRRFYHIHRRYTGDQGQKSLDLGQPKSSRQIRTHHGPISYRFRDPR